MKRVFSSVFLVAMLALVVNAQTPDGGELTRLLKAFLDGASRNDAAIHDRFWAEDLIYTGSSGRRIGKADILRDARSAQTPRAGEPATTYSAEDIRIQQYGDTAIVAFRLVGTTGKAGTTTNYLNTGTFLKRNGKWQAVSWQATRMPRSEEESRKDIAEAASELTQIEHRLVKLWVAGDRDAVDAILATDWSVIDLTGRLMTKAHVMKEFGSGDRRVESGSVDDLKVRVFGETAVVTGRSALTGSYQGKQASVVQRFTDVFVKRDGRWQAVASQGTQVEK
ncbi:MAG TPA: nuclear transport factor 2 family protein [Blastocatellia bacterium]|nr:nuclear transport factor 2 family protein [Blastocatellia bacterium]